MLYLGQSEGLEVTVVVVSRYTVGKPCPRIVLNGTLQTRPHKQTEQDEPLYPEDDFEPVLLLSPWVFRLSLMPTGTAGNDT